MAEQNNYARVKLGIPLDLMLDRECKLEDWEVGKGVPGGLRIPEKNKPANSSIIIRGRPGTGKSLLALQMAVKCCQYNAKKVNNPGYFVVYISLEESWEQVYSKAVSFSWNKRLEPLASLSELGAFSSPAEYGQVIKRILTRPENCPLRLSYEPLSSKNNGNPDHKHGESSPNPVIVSSLSPRNLTLDKEYDNAVFTARYQQLEHLLRGSTWLRENDGSLPQLRMVCIDSLNVFGDQLLTREQIHQLFDLFRQQCVIGVFVMEEDEGQLLSPDARLHADTIEYLSDTVIVLRADEDSDYFVRYFEIVKSRYQHQIYGRHPFRIMSPNETHEDEEHKQKSEMKEPKEEPEEEPKKETEEGLIIYPSLHYIVYGTEPKYVPKSQDKEKNPFPIGDKNLQVLLPPDCYLGDVVLIVGPRGTFKQSLALNFLLSGLLTDDEKAHENTLFIRLHDRPGFSPSPDIRLSSSIKSLDQDWLGKLEKYETIEIPERPTKYSIKAYKYRYNENMERIFIEMAFKSGNILPEEFLHHVRYVIRLAKSIKYPITRIVLGEVGLIGVNYPFLKKSRTAGEIFLTAIVHTLRNYRDISLLITGTTGQYDEADRMINRTRTLADTVLTCSRCDVFGNRLVVIEGERLVTGLVGEFSSGDIQRDYGEYVPAVIVPYKDEEKGINLFEIDLHRLDGLVGFGTGEILRPGLICRVLQEGQIQKMYNDSIRRMLPHTFGDNKNDKGASGIKIDTYTSQDSANVFESLELGRNKPLQHTLVAAIDEFCLGAEIKGGSEKVETLARSAFISLEKRIPNYEEISSEFMDTIWRENISHAHPYYANVMLLAYRIRDDNDEPICIQWKGQELNLAAVDEQSRLPAYNSKPYMWRHVKRFVDKIHAELQNHSSVNENGPYHLFDWMDVPETWACIFLDALVNSAFLKYKTRKDYIEDISAVLNIPAKVKGMNSEEARNKIHEIDKNRGDMISGLLRSIKPLKSKPLELGYVQKPLIHSLSALRDLFQESGRNRNKTKTSGRNHSLSPWSAAYVCWYSQLRNLIRKNPDLANKLDICPLPGGGFRGDWYLGVAQGSVSVALGVELIRTLCFEHEEYRRFSLGVGMPVRRKFYEKGEKGDYYAWKGGLHVPLKKLQDIHRDALTRESIPGYRRFHNVLQTVCHQVVGKPGEVIPYTKYEEVWETIKRLPAQISMLLPQNDG